MGHLQKLNKTILILISLLALYLAYIFIPQSNDFPTTEPAIDNLTVHFIDVGQGDATLLKGPDFTVLIDAGRHDRNDVVPYLQEQNIQQIDLLVGTHPHADHIGQFPQVLEKFLVNEVWLSGDIHTSRTFEKTLDAILESNAKYNEPRARETHTFGSLYVEIIHPTNVTGDLNNGSIVLRIRFHDVVLLFTGDAELDAENEIIESGQELNSNILKVGHHGSRSSTSDLFLEKIRPEIAVYSSAENNAYGHPDSEVIGKLNNLGIEVYGTDLDGTVILTIDGETYEIETKKNEVNNFSNAINCIDINSASKSKLTDILYIDTSRAEQLIGMRPYNSLDELTMISGIGINRLSDLKEEGKACLN